VAARNISAGSRITADDLTWKRPGKGIDPRDYDIVVGSKTSQNIDVDTVLNWNHLAL